MPTFGLTMLGNFDGDLARNYTTWPLQLRHNVKKQHSITSHEIMVNRDEIRIPGFIIPKKEEQDLRLTLFPSTSNQSKQRLAGNCWWSKFHPKEPRHYGLLAWHLIGLMPGPHFLSSRASGKDLPPCLGWSQSGLRWVQDLSLWPQSV